MKESSQTENSYPEIPQSEYKTHSKLARPHRGYQHVHGKGLGLQLLAISSIALRQRPLNRLKLTSPSFSVFFFFSLSESPQNTSFTGYRPPYMLHYLLRRKTGDTQASSDL